MTEWKETALQDIAYVNPTESISNGTKAKKVPMELLEPFTKRVSGYQIEEYKGGVKFKNGDTIIARITPSLENGKTAFIDILEDDEIGFGSTEFIVLREKEGLSDKNFLYYLALSPDFRETAILSMTGSSGRQRVQTDVVKEHLFNIPSLPEQRAIASILSSLDDKIDLLHRQNKTLEEMAEALYDARFEDKDLNNRVSDLIELQNGYAFKSKDFQDYGENRVLKIKNISGGIVDIQATDFVSDETVDSLDDNFSIHTGDILFAMTGAKIGKMGIIPKTDYHLWLNQRVGLFKEKYYGSRFLAYLHLKSDYGKDYIDNTATGSAQPNISGTGIEQCEFPAITEQKIIDYSKQLAPIYEKLIFNLGQAKKLEALRDTILPKLMSGEVKVEIDG
ncbi:MAG: restriction endonuclease subunit S [Bacteroidales bacterium]|nr:restriction endonuclease subunit S [Bacteroidales bacterium]